MKNAKIISVGSFILTVIILSVFWGINKISVKNKTSEPNKDLSSEQNITKQTVDWSEYKQNVFQNMKQAPETADSLFYKYKADLKERVNNTEIIEYCSEESVNKAKTINNNDLEIAYRCMEGDLNPDIDYKQLYENFSNILSNEYVEYLSILKDETPAAEDGGLAVPLEDIRLRINKREKFLLKYPSFIENNDIKADIKIYYFYYTGGLDNTRITCKKDTMSSEFYEDVLKSYRKFLEENDSKNSMHYTEIKNCYDSLINN